jgi:hypothetical protein
LAANIDPTERRILVDLGRLSDRLRVLRSAGQAAVNEIRLVEAQMSLKWQQLRSLRAGPINAEEHSPERRTNRT